MLLYNLVIFFYGLGIRIASIKKTKAKQWVRGRRHWRKALTFKIAGLNSEERIWVHCASYGEFEQGRPLLEAIRARHPSKKIILTFFSPSGFEEFRDWPGADIISYLPLDTPKNARDFISIVNPQAVIFIKYEFWINFLRQLKIKNIPTFLVSATFKEHHPFFKSYGRIFRGSLQSFEKLFVQDEDSARLLNHIGITNHEVCGDTRFDRVIEIRKNFRELDGLNKFKGASKIIAAGSTWPKDEELILTAFKALSNKNLKLILAPHNVDEKSLEETINKLKKHDLQYSVITEGIKSGSQVLVIDTIGILSRLYYYADLAYVGGGFNGGLHNTLEPSVYGIPVAFAGEHFVKYNEAVQLVKLGAAEKVDSVEELSDYWNRLLSDPTKTAKISADLALFFEKNGNATNRILESLPL